MNSEVSRSLLQELQDKIDALLRAPYDHPEVTQWKLTVSTILEARFGAEHRLVKAFGEIPFRRVVRYASASYDGVLSRPLPTDSDHQSAFQSDLETARAIIGAALVAWPAGKGNASDQATPTAVVTITNQNANNAESTATNETNVLVELPLAELLDLVARDEALTSDQKLQAKEQLEDLNRELRTDHPRWEKIKPAVKFLVDASKEVAIKVLGAVVAKQMTGM